ncbi:hypothetical protein CERSUDRAFT_125230 [Gelatoporia subvermispora B]|uniref:Uncharacterized protein n=1 Tax=Ceriporiopsis subvermispora (strain B) TaxID=914234 RepID=M2R878_CERS8|nr:hypothetical protein CERSUDRAFT_125230 [Gelatoporia subvermispora B]
MEYSGYSQLLGALPFHQSNWDASSPSSHPPPAYDDVSKHAFQQGHPPGAKFDYNDISYGVQCTEIKDSRTATLTDDQLGSLRSLGTVTNEPSPHVLNRPSPYNPLHNIHSHPHSGAYPAVSSPGNPILVNSPLLFWRTLPPSFSRPLPPNLPYGVFPTISSISVSRSIKDGFSLSIPQSAVTPHPFPLHDVSQGDWILFVQQIRAAAGLTMMDRFMYDVVPMALNSTLVPALFLKDGYIKISGKRKQVGSVGELIRQWNAYFFHPRQMDVALCRGQMSYTNSGSGLPSNGQGAGTEVDKSDHRHRRKAVKREKKREKKVMKRKEKDARDEYWTLVVSHHTSLTPSAQWLELARYPQLFRIWMGRELSHVPGIMGTLWRIRAVKCDMHLTTNLPTFNHEVVETKSLRNTNASFALPS